MNELKVFFSSEEDLYTFPAEDTISHVRAYFCPEVGNVHLTANIDDDGVITYHRPNDTEYWCQVYSAESRMGIQLRSRPRCKHVEKIKPVEGSNAKK